MEQLITKKEVVANVVNLFEQLYDLDAQILLTMQQVKLPTPKYYKELITLIMLFDREKTTNLQYIFGESVSITPIVNAHPDMKLIIYAEKELKRIKAVMKELYLQIKFLSLRDDASEISEQNLKTHEENIKDCLCSLKRILLSHDDFLNKISEISNINKEKLIENPDEYLNEKTILDLCEVAFKKTPNYKTFFENLN